MEAGQDASFYKLALIVLGAAGVVIPIFHRMRINPVLGFILVGIAVGPFGIGALATYHPWLGMVTIDAPEAVEPIAELGVALLLFMIGLELSFERLWVMRRLVFGLGMLQVVFTTAALAGIGVMFGQAPSAAAVAGSALAMSSTAVVLQLLAGEKRLNTPTGRISFAILLFQDLAVVLVLFGVNALASSTQEASVVSLGMTLAEPFLAVAAIVALGRMILRPLFRSVARTRSTELFIAACLFVVIGSAVATAASGLSMALGALIGGSLLAGTEYRRQVEITIEPFKGLLVGVFLISIGMDLDIATILAHPLIVAGAVIGLIAVKVLVIAPLVRVFGQSWATGVQSGLLLGPGGEFGFVILALAASKALLSKADVDLLLAIVAVTMTMTPLLAKLGQALAPRVSGRNRVDPTLLVPPVADTVPRVIVSGFGRVGQTVAGMLDVHRIPYVAIDADPDLVARHRARGRPIYFGDMTRVDMLRNLHLETALALVITLDDPEMADRLVACAREERSDLLIVSRARDARHAAQLYKAGASDAVPETVEASLQLAEALLVDIGVPMGPVLASVHQKRSEIQADIKAMAPDVTIRPLGRRRLRDSLREPI